MDPQTNTVNDVLDTLTGKKGPKITVQVGAGTFLALGGTIAGLLLLWFIFRLILNRRKAA